MFCQSGGVRSASFLAAALLVTATGCANAGSPSAEPTPAGQPTALCTSFSPVSLAQVARVDLDGDGIADKLQRVDDGDCHLLVGRDGTTPLDISALDLPPGATFETVQLKGTKRQLVLVSGASHLRGGVQPYLVGEAANVIGLVTYQGNPLLPFIATDGGELPGAAHCNASGGIDVVSVARSKDSGLAVAYDVTTTSYTLAGDVATPAAQRSAGPVPDDQLRTEQPELFDATRLLSDCVTG